MNAKLPAVKEWAEIFYRAAGSRPLVAPCGPRIKRAFRRAHPPGSGRSVEHGSHGGCPETIKKRRTREEGARERAQPHTHAREVFVFISLNQTGVYEARWN